MDTNCRIVRCNAVEATELDCPHWLPDALDLEPEQCFCLRCGEALPCPCQAHKPYLTKELIPHA